MARISNREYIFLNNYQEQCIPASAQNDSDTQEVNQELQQESYNPFDVYCDMHNKLYGQNASEETKLDVETFNKVMSGEIATDDALALNVIQAAMIDEEKDSVSQSELDELYNVYFSETETALDSVRNFIENPYELLAQYYLGRDLKDCTDEEINQIYTLNLIKQTLASSQENLKNQDNLDGFISETWDFGKELTGWGTCQKDVEKELAKQEEIVKELEQALIDGNFNEKYLELTGVEFDIDKITEQQERLSEIQFVQRGLEKINAFCDSLSESDSQYNVEETYNKFIEFYGEEKGEEKFLETLKEGYNNNFSWGSYDPNNLVEKAEFDEHGNVIITFANGDICDVGELKYIDGNILTYMYSEKYKEGQLNDYLENLEKTTNINYQETLEEYDRLTKEALGNANKATEILTEYIKSQESFIDACAIGAQWTGMGLMAIGSIALLCGCPAGAGIMNAGNWVAIGGMFGDNIAEGIDLATNNNFIKGDEEYYKGLLKETLTDTALFYSGYKINGISSQFESLIAEIGVDASLSLLADLIITGEIDLSGEGISQLLGIFTGKARAKLDSMKANTNTKTNFIDPMTTSQYTLMPDGSYRYNGNVKVETDSINTSSSSGRKYVVDVESGTIKPQEIDTNPVNETKTELDHPVAGDNIGTGLKALDNEVQISAEEINRRTSELRNMGVAEDYLESFTYLNETQYQRVIELINKGVHTGYIKNIATTEDSQRYQKALELLDNQDFINGFKHQYDLGFESKYKALSFIGDLMNFNENKYNAALELINKGINSLEIKQLFELNDVELREALKLINDGEDITKARESAKLFNDDTRKLIKAIMKSDSLSDATDDEIITLIKLYTNASKNKAVNAEEFIAAYCYFKSLPLGREGRMESTEIISYLFDIDPSSVESSNIQMLLYLVQEGTVGEHILGFIPSGGKLSQEVIDDVVKLYEASESGIKPIDMFVPTFKNTTEAVMGGNDSVLFEGSYLDIKVGDVFQVEGEEFIRIKTSDTESIQLNISKETYFKLFPPVERYATTQNAIGNCWEVSGINTLLNSPDTRAMILSLFSQDGNDIVIRLPGDSFKIKSYGEEKVYDFQEHFKEVRFENGELPDNIDMQYYSQGALGFQMLEYTEGRMLQANLLTKIYSKYDECIAYAETEADKTNWRKELAEFNKFLAEHKDKTYIKEEDGYHYYEEYSGEFDNVISQARNAGHTAVSFAAFLGLKEVEVLGFGKANNEKLYDMLSNPETFNDYTIGYAVNQTKAYLINSHAFCSYVGDIGYHAYGIKPGAIGPDGKIKTCKLINPWGAFEEEISLGEIIDYGSHLYIAKK